MTMDVEGFGPMSASFGMKIAAPAMNDAMIVVAIFDACAGVNGQDFIFRDALDDAVAKIALAVA